MLLIKLIKLVINNVNEIRISIPYGSIFCIVFEKIKNGKKEKTCKKSLFAFCFVHLCFLLPVLYKEAVFVFLLLRVSQFLFLALLFPSLLGKPSLSIWK